MADKGNSKKIILLVDDDRFLLDMYAVKFGEAGLTVEACVSGEEALAKLRGGFRASAILLDVVMPGISGFELLKMIKDENLGDGMATIVLSNQGERADIDKAKMLGADGYIVKASTIPSEVLEKTLEIMKGRSS